MTKTKSAMTMGRALLLGGALMAFAAPALAQTDTALAAKIAAAGSASTGAATPSSTTEPAR